MKRNRLIIIEGPQGTGKTGLSNYLRDKIPGSNLYRLSGQKDKTKKGKELSEKMYCALLTYLKEMETIPMDLIFDRTFFTEEVYARLGYKEYDFHDVYLELVDKLCQLNFDMYLVLLHLENPSIYEERLKRDHHQYQAFSTKNSTDQQDIYLQIKEELKDTNIKIISLATDDFKEAYQKIDTLFEIEHKN